MRTRPAVSGLCLLLLGYGAVHAVAAGAERYPLEYFALREVVNNVTVSPDGERLAMLKILSRTGNPILHIYDTNDLDADPLVIDADPMEIIGYQWTSDRHVVLQFRQQVRNRLQGQEGSVFGYRIAILDVIDESIDDFDTNTAPRIENVLEGKPNQIIVSEQEGFDNSVGVREAYRPRAYYTVNLERGTKQLIIRGRVDMGRIQFDSDGNPRVAQGFDIRARDYLVYYRDPGETSWREVYRWTEDQFEGFLFEDMIGLDDSVPGNILVLAFNGDDKLGLWSFNPETKTFDELIYRRSDVDVYGVRYHSNSWTYPDRITAVSYFKDKLHFEYFDEIEGATFNQLEQLVPYAHYVSITSRSREGNTMVVRNVGPRDPGTHYLLHQGEFEFLGSTHPLLDSEELADVQYIQYTARDGRPMATFVTIPNTGEPPYPTVVMPHGGPFVREVVLFDEWAQMLANNGYMVVQPQFRMTLGYGFDHFMSSIIDDSASGLMVSQAGRRMQDDKDDAALHLVDMGLADPDRMAMYGWSYGGYAALIAASRTPQIYQCTIAGAAVSDYVTFANDTMRGRAPTGAARILRDVFQYGAVQPVREVENVNVPLLLIHGSLDSRVVPKQAQLYRDALDRAGKDYKYVELEGADHFYNTLYYEHQIELYTSIIDFLQNDCGNLSGGETQASNAGS